MARRREGTGGDNWSILAGPHTLVLRRPLPAPFPEHANPGWKIVVPLAGTVEWGDGPGAARTAPAVVFPPEVRHRVLLAAGSLTVHVDAWFMGLGPPRCGAVPLAREVAGWLRSLWSSKDAGRTDADETARAMVSYLRREQLLAPPVPMDARVVAALEALPHVERIQELADRVGLSASWLRTLVRDHTGTPLVRLRMWHRLRRSLLRLRERPIAEAAVDAGFADQPHLTRTARDLIGHTPSTLLMQLR